MRCCVETKKHFKCYTDVKLREIGKTRSYDIKKVIIRITIKSKLGEKIKKFTHSLSLSSLSHSVSLSLSLSLFFSDEPILMKIYMNANIKRGKFPFHDV